MTLPTGDLQEIARLRKLYNDLLAKKYEFIEAVGNIRLSAKELAEAEIKLIETSCEIMRIDEGIHIIMFGGEPMPATNCLTLMGALRPVVEKEAKDMYQGIIDSLSLEISQKNARITRLNEQINLEQAKTARVYNKLYKLNHKST